MTSEERTQATMLLGGLAEVLGQELTTARLALLLEDIDDIPFDKVQIGIKLARRRFRFIPAPRDLRDLCFQAAPLVLGPSLAAIREERGRVRDSWRNGPPVPTLQEMVEGCRRNADLAERQAQSCRDRIDRLPIGDTEAQRLKVELGRHLSDYQHWSDYVGHYRERVAKEGAGVVPKVGTFGGFAAPPQPPAPATRKPTDLLPEDPRLPREPGMDDDEPARQIVVGQ